MKVYIEAKQICEVEYFIVLNLLGVFLALSEGVISIDDAENIIFSPAYAETAEKLGVNSDIVRLIWDGTELEDVESLCPEKLTNNILELKSKALNLFSKILNHNIPLEYMKITIDNGVHATVKSLPDEIRFEEEEE